MLSIMSIQLMIPSLSDACCHFFYQVSDICFCNKTSFYYFSIDGDWVSSKVIKGRGLSSVPGGGLCFVGRQVNHPSIELELEFNSTGKAPCGDGAGAPGEP